ncbi:MAG TPA: ABC transporter permease [Anaerolineae bacterium]|nr:ABC transporter permease [Anaerolineae bacterium]
MAHYLLKRALSSLIALFIFVSFMFFVTEIMIPGDFTTQFSEQLSVQQRAALQESLGLNVPLGQRYLNWLGNLSHGDLGMSLYGSAVTTVLGNVLPYTLLVFFIGTLIAFQLGQWLGRWAAWPSGSADRWLTSIKRTLSGGMSLGAVIFYTAFPPWLCFLVATCLSQHLSMVREFRYGQRGRRELFMGKIWKNTALTPPVVMVKIVITFVVVWLFLGWVNRLLARKFHWRLSVGIQLLLFVSLLVGSWYVLGFGPWALSVMESASSALITYVLLSFGETLLIMRTSMADTLQEDYITTARAKGVAEAMVRDGHAARTALLPVLSRFIVSFPYMLTGVVIVEDVLGWPGVSRSLFNSLYQQDMPVVMGALLLVGIVSAVARLALDVVYAVLDPRIRYDRGGLRRAA